MKDSQMRAASLFAELDTLIRASQFPGALRVATTDDSAVGFAMDAVETDNAYLVKANLPGIAKENIAIEVDGNKVKITASPTPETLASEGEKLIRRERYAGKFERQFTLSADIDSDAVSAKLEHGVLAVTLPKKVVLAAKRISIQ
jgi:HSP20 family protein